MTAIVAGTVVSFFLFVYALVYWRNADMDFMVVYNALVLNDGKPQRFFDHTIGPLAPTVPQHAD